MITLYQYCERQQDRKISFTYYSLRNWLKLWSYILTTVYKTYSICHWEKHLFVNKFRPIIFWKHMKIRRNMNLNHFLISLYLRIIINRIVEVLWRPDGPFGMNLRTIRDIKFIRKCHLAFLFSPLCINAGVRDDIHVTRETLTCLLALNYISGSDSDWQLVNSVNTVGKCDMYSKSHDVFVHAYGQVHVYVYILEVSL